jgi:hypothetical protein
MKDFFTHVNEHRKSPEVFLGGTTNNSDWREKLIPLLKIKHFNPVVKDWNEEAQKKEIEKRESCEFVLYVITPKMIGVYSIAEAVDDSNKRPEKTVFCVLNEDGEGKEKVEFNTHQKKSLKMVKEMIEKNGGAVLPDLEAVADHLNEKKL